MRRLAVQFIITMLANLGIAVWVHEMIYEPRHSLYYYETGIVRPDLPASVHVLVIGCLFLVNIINVLYWVRQARFNQVRDGVIIGRKHTAAYTVPERSYPMWVGKVMIMQRQNAYDVPDKWELNLRRADGKTGWIAVNQAAYNLPDGAYIDFRGHADGEED